MIPLPRIPWTPEDNDMVARAVAGTLSLDELFDGQSHRTFKALRRRYVTWGSKPNEETRHRRSMTFGSTALRRAIESYHARSTDNSEQ